jgi:hypothetical protein
MVGACGCRIEGLRGTWRPRCGDIRIPEFFLNAWPLSCDLLTSRHSWYQTGLSVLLCIRGPVGRVTLAARR